MKYEGSKRLFWGLNAILFVCLFLTPWVALAQNKVGQKGRIKREVHKLGGESVTLPILSGWVKGKAPQGSVLLLRAAGDSKSQLEVKFMPGIQKEQSKRFFTSFHTHLKKMGMVKVGEAKALAFHHFTGGELHEYNVTSSGQKYRMMVWQGLRKNAAWMIVGFFPEQARVLHFKSFQTLISSIVFGAA